MDINHHFCKYCLDNSEENEQTIIYPCQCSDGVHANCLAIWLVVRSKNNDRSQCEICKTDYIGVMIPALSPPPSPRSQIPPSPTRTLTPPPPPPIENDEILEEHVSLEYICCSCYRLECASYISGAVLTFSAFFMTIGQTNNQDFHYYTGLTVLIIVACFSFALASTLTGRRYYRRLQDIRTINTMPVE